MAAGRRSKIDALLEQETRQQLNSSSCSTTRLNSAWRQKVVHWYFKLIGALHRQNTTAASSNGTSRTSGDPFNRTTVHISAYLLDSYLMSLPQEEAMRYRHNRPAYQLLATTCLLLGIRIAKHDAVKSSPNAQDVNKSPAKQSFGMKRAKKCTNMSLMSATSNDGGPSSPSSSSPGIAIPNATTILSMSAAPNTITEQNVLDMVKKLTSSRDFPRSKVVTTLDYIYALSASSTQVSEEDGQSISLGPQDVEEASRITDTLLSDVNIVSTPPSVVACAIITIALSRSNALNNLDMTSIRQKVYYSIFGSKIDPDLQIATLRAETTVGVTAPPPRHRRPVPITTHHIIPFD